MRVITTAPRMVSTPTELSWSFASISRRAVEQFTAACVDDAPLPLVTLTRIWSSRWSTHRMRISVTDTSGRAVGAEVASVVAVGARVGVWVGVLVGTSVGT